MIAKSSIQALLLLQLYNYYFAIGNEMLWYTYLIDDRGRISTYYFVAVCLPQHLF